jgi:hypothetical protein
MGRSFFIEFDAYVLVVEFSFTCISISLPSPTTTAKKATTRDIKKKFTFLDD